MMRRAVLTIIVACFAAAPVARAASNVSSKFDGTYTGQADPAPGMGAGCPGFVIDEIVVVKGILHSASRSTQPTVSGFVTEEGYVAASMARPGAASYPLDGRLEDETISAGFIDTAANCYWVVHLKRRSE